MVKEILTETLVVTDQTANDWREAVKLCGDLLINEGKITEDYIASMIQTVEEYGPYMIMLPGIALFHGRPSEGVKEICLSLVTFSEPVSFSEFGDKAINAAFAFGAVDSNSHVELLSKMAALLQDEAFVALLRSNGEKEEIMHMIKNY